MKLNGRTPPKLSITITILRWTMYEQKKWVGKIAVMKWFWILDKKNAQAQTQTHTRVNVWNVKSVNCRSKAFQSH